MSNYSPEVPDSTPDPEDSMDPRIREVDGEVLPTYEGDDAPVFRPPPTPEDVAEIHAEFAHPQSEKDIALAAARKILGQPAERDSGLSLYLDKASKRHQGVLDSRARHARNRRRVR